MTGAAPSGVVTFLFTDVEGLTRRWEVDADGMRAALAAHDEVLRKAIEAHGGFMFKHTGDGVCAAFSSPKSAVDAAVAAQVALELPVRMGLATGEAELRDGDYFGTVLNRAARVMAAGHGGQILVADSAAVLLSGLDLVDLGPRRLRDVSAPVGVFQVRAPGLRTKFPSLRGVDSNPENLRPAITSLIGRDAEVTKVEAALRAHRLVTLAGVGGVGKTRLAVEVATQLADEFVDVFGFSSWRRWLILLRYRMQWRRYWESLNNPARASASRWPRLWRAGRGYWCSTTVSTWWTASRIWLQRSSRPRRR
jgi:class 3 adenylate cyclase